MRCAAFRSAAALTATVGALSVSFGSCTAELEGSGDSAEDRATEPAGAVAGSIDSASIESRVGATLSDLGMAPRSVLCPEDLAPEVGEDSRCEVELGGSTFGVTVTVASTEGDQAVLDVVVDDQPS